MSIVRGKQRIDRRYYSGMNSYDNAYEIAEHQCASIKNGFVSQSGKIQQRKGLTALGDTLGSDTKCLGLGILETGTNKFLYRVLNDDVYRYVSGTWTALSASLTAGLNAHLVQANNLLFVSNGTDNVQSINTSDAVTDEGNTNADPPRGNDMEWHDNRLFVSGVSGESTDTFVYFSDIKDPQTFDRAVNVFNANKGAKGKVTELKSFKEKELILYKENTILVLNTLGADPLNDWEIKLFNPLIGCPAGRTVVNVGNDHVFLGNDGIRILSRSQFDTIQAGIISHEIQDVIEDINWNAISTARAIYFDNKYIISLPTGVSTTPNTILIWDSLATAAARQKGFDVNSWVIIPAGTWDIADMVISKYNTTPELITGTSTNQKIYRAFQGYTDDGTAINYNVVFREESFEVRDIDKDFSHVFVTMQGEDDVAATFTYKIDEGAATASEPTSVRLRGRLPILEIDLPFNLSAVTRTQEPLYAHKRGRTFQLIMDFNETITSDETKFFGYELYGDIKEQKDLS